MGWGPSRDRDDGEGAVPALRQAQNEMEAGIAAGLHCPWAVGPAREGEIAFPREVPAEALRPRSVPQVPCAKIIADPVPVPAGSAPCLAAGFGSLAGSFLLKPCGLEFRFPIGLTMKRSFVVSFRGSFSPGASGSAGPSKESGFGFGLRRCLALLPSGCPDLRFLRLPSEDFRRFPRGRAWKLFSVSGRPLPATGRTLAPESESRQALNRGSGLWITGITGINLD